MDNWGHFGGLLAGFLLGTALFDRVEAGAKRETLWRAAAGCGLGLLALGGLIGFYCGVEPS